ncbi:MAG: AEC family transporter [Ilumatobacter sp.]
MSIASLLVDVLGPVVVLVAIGAVVGPRIGVEAGSLSKLAYWILGPAFMFASLYAAELDGALIAKLVAAALAGMVIAGGGAWTVMRIAGAGYGERGATALTSSYGNVGNAGLAICAFALGDEILPIASVLMLTVNSAGLVFGVGVAAARTTSRLAALGRAVTAPMTVAAWLAIAANVGDVSLPLVAERPLELVAGALIPVMLLTLGMQLVSTGLPSFDRALGVSIVAKLAVAPLAAGVVIRSLGVGGDPAAAVIIQSAMPPAVFCALLALEHDFETDRVTSAVVASTMVSIVTLPVVLAITT